MQPDQIDSRVIDMLVQRSVDIVHPLRIILFGSAARGEMHLDSDIDVLVVMPEGIPPPPDCTTPLSADKGGQGSFRYFSGHTWQFGAA